MTIHLTCAILFPPPPSPSFPLLPPPPPSSPLLLLLATRGSNETNHGTQRTPRANSHFGPFAPGWYAGEDALPPHLSARADCLYILFNIATLDLAGEGRGGWGLGGAQRVVEKIAAAVVGAGDGDSDCCDLHTLMMTLVSLWVSGWVGLCSGVWVWVYGCVRVGVL